MSAISDSADGGLTTNDLRLIDEAVGRLRASRGGDQLDISAMTTALIAEMRRGRRDLFSLIRAGQRVLDQQ